VDQIAALAARHGGVVLDIFSAWPKTEGWADKYLNDDKLHLNRGRMFGRGANLLGGGVRHNDDCLGRMLPRALLCAAPVVCAL
jgi:hypothetical protein